jgi:hypothetical protein
MKKSPLQLVKEKFESKEALVAKLVTLLEREEGEEDAAFSARVSKISNAKLLRLWQVEERVQKDFGGRNGLVDAIVAFKFPHKGNADYRTKLAKQANTRLLDLHDSLRRAAARG